ncbi:MAG: hypothetical protein JWO53_676 [Chlamydiia bacterium]|nr:hypothetical protein [Chlamydiia bacterium]
MTENGMCMQEIYSKLSKSSFSRVMIFGIPGSGKSTFAVRLGELVHLPVDHLDRHFFVANWAERDYSEFLQIQKTLVEKERWIIDGNSIKSFEMRFQRATLVLYFKYNRLLCLWRIFKRLFRKNPQILDKAEGCPEKVRLRLISYLWGFDIRVSHSIQELCKKYPDVPFYVVQSDREAEKIIQKFYHEFDTSKESQDTIVNAIKEKICKIPQ